MSDLPRVTAILAAVGLLNFSRVPGNQLAIGQARGTATHAVIEAEFYGYDVPSAPADAGPRLAAYTTFVRESGYRVECMEFEVVHAAQSYCGHPDSRGFLFGRRGIVDIKTGMLGPVIYQLGGYRAAWNAMAPQTPVEWIAAVQLRADGTYRFHEVDITEAEAKWYAALTVYRDVPRNGQRQEAP